MIDGNTAVAIDHTFVSDLSAFLVGPDGTKVERLTNEVGSRFSLTDTVFSDQADVAIEAGRHWLH